MERDTEKKRTNRKCPPFASSFDGWPREREEWAPEKSRASSEFSEWASSVLAFIDDLNIVAVRIKHPSGIIAGIVFETSLR